MSSHLYGESFGSYLPTALDKYHRPGQGHFKNAPVLFISGFDFVQINCRHIKEEEEEEEEEDGETGALS